MPKTKPTTVTEYIDAAPKEAQKKLREIRAIVKKWETTLEGPHYLIEVRLVVTASPVLVVGGVVDGR